MGLELLLAPFRYVISTRTNKLDLKDPEPPLKHTSTIVETPLGILKKGLLEYATSISALRSYHQHRAIFKSLESEGHTVESYNPLSLEFRSLATLSYEVEKRSQGKVDVTNSGLYLALQDGSGTIFGNHAKINDLIDKGVNPDFVAGFWFLFCLNNLAFECVHVDPGRSIETFDNMDEASRKNLITSVHGLRMKGIEYYTKIGRNRVKPSTDYFVVIAEPDFHRYDIKMLLPYSALTTQ